MTQQRRVILEELNKLTSHPTAEELHRIVRNRLPKISIATVYRNLEILSAEGEVLKLEVAGTQRRFDGTTDNHYHIRCSVCGRVDDVHMALVDDIEETAQKNSGYGVLSHRIEFTGICPDCTGKN
ncbi:MAG TPA: transcriptional repressor [Desulfomonilaceae bacterium]|nr:transcriptional repressor [Desulfomonilaceae bacterium]